MGASSVTTVTSFVALGACLLGLYFFLAAPSPHQAPAPKPVATPMSGARHRVTPVAESSRPLRKSFSKPTAQSYPPFCSQETCPSPTAMYPEGSPLNMPSLANTIPRNSPDGINLWPYKCNNTQCSEYLYEVLPAATWWSNYTEQQALPTNAWWLSYFSNPPFNVNPAGWAWPVYEIPYTTLAMDGMFGTGWPLAQQFKGQPGIMQGMPEDANTTAPLLQVATVFQHLTFTAVEGLSRTGVINGYDRMGSGVTLRYSGISAAEAARRQAREANADRHGVHAKVTDEDAEEELERQEEAQAQTSSSWLEIPVIKGCPYMTLIYSDLTPIMNINFGIVNSVNDVPTDLPTSPNTTVAGVPLANNPAIWVYDVQLYSSPGTLGYEYRIYTNYNAGVATVRMPSPRTPWSITFATCKGVCVFRVAISQNLFLDPNFPAPFYADISQGGHFTASSAVLDEYVNVYPMLPPEPVPAGVSFNSSTPWGTTTVRFTWQVSCMTGAPSACNPDDLLMLALPHHQDILVSTTSSGSSVPVAGLAYPTMSGVGLPFAGADWLMVYDNANILMGILDEDPFYGNLLIRNGTWATTLSQTLQADIAFFTTSDTINNSFIHADCYAFGKLTAAMARLVLIADELDETELARTGRDALINRLNQWFNPNITSWEYPVRSSEAFTYDTVWGGVIPSDAVQEPGPFWVEGGAQPEFGSGGYNDHLFHYGYFMYAAAAVIHSMEAEDLAWFAGIQDRVVALARDVANPDQAADPYFAQFRYKSDWYAGHAWASGLYPSANNPNIESTSEAINAWYAIYLLGFAINETGQAALGATLQDVGLTMLITDLHAFDMYTHMYATADSMNPTRALVYPTEFSQYGVVGNLWAGQVIYQTFFDWGICQSVDYPSYKDPGLCQGLHQLTVPQLRYSNELFIIMIQILPFTPITQAVVNPDWLANFYNTAGISFTVSSYETSYGYGPLDKAETFPDMYGKCELPGDLYECQSWLPYSWQLLAMTNSTMRDVAWESVQSYTVALAGSSASNMLWFIGRQP